MHGTEPDRDSTPNTNTTATGTQPAVPTRKTQHTRGQSLKTNNQKPKKQIHRKPDLRTKQRSRTENENSNRKQKRRRTKPKQNRVKKKNKRKNENNADLQLHGAAL
jgi:hypothetical protein